MTPSVLIVANSLTVRMDIAEVFEASGSRPFPCATLTDARQILARHALDLSVLDVGQTDAEGVTLAAEARRLLAGQAPLLFLFSGDAPPSHSRTTTRREFWIQKPYNAEQLVTQARLLLSVHAPRSDASPLVLLIDDSLTFRTEMERVLSDRGFLVETAATGEAGLKLLTQLRPAAVIVDGVLPGIDGVTVIRRIRLDPSLRGVPCVLLTAAQDTEAELKALDSGADAFARKDDDAEVLIARVQAVIRAAPASENNTKPILPAPRKILAVDDSLTYRSRLAESLQEEGYEVLQASSGEEAIELLSRQSVDCVLLDLMMPGIGGKETCRQLKSSAVVRNIPVILLTGVEER
jgi:DNA-binding response OmpR family regulator